jgi:hypothetical protein
VRRNKVEKVILKWMKGMGQDKRGFEGIREATRMREAIRQRQRQEEGV